MKLWFKLALREIRNNSRFSLFFILNLSLGLSGFIGLDTFKTSLENYFDHHSKTLLSADIKVSSARPLSEKERKLIKEVYYDREAESIHVRFFSMVFGKESSRLVDVSAIDNFYPLYGRIRLKKHGLATKSFIQKNLLGSKSAWVYNDLLIALGLQIGDQLKLGRDYFTITDVIEEDPVALFTTFGFAPRAYIGLNQIKDTGLVQTGSRVFYSRFFRFPEKTNIEKYALRLTSRFAAIGGSSLDIRVQSHSEAGQRMERIFGYLNNYLGLIALIALFLAGIGVAYLFRNFLSGRFQEMAVLLSLGAKKSEAFRIYLIQIVLLGLSSALVAVVFSVIMIPLLPSLLKDFLPHGFNSSLNIQSVLIACFLGTLGSVLFCLPVLKRIKELEPALLFNENRAIHQFRDFSNVSYYLNYLPAFFSFWLLSIWQAGSIKEGSLFVGLFILSLVLLTGLGWIFFSAPEIVRSPTNIRLKLAFRNLGRQKIAAISCFISIALGSLLFNLVPQIQNGLHEEISTPKGFQIPSFFLFDIQAEQVTPLKRFLQEKGIALSSLSPMVRARINSVNGEPFFSPNKERTSLNRRGANLSYRATLFKSEKIVTGRELAKAYDFSSGKPAEISLEERFAERMNLKIGDVLAFDIQGVMVEGTVINLRKVKWNSFQPNFFIIFQTGVLENAPKTFLASIAGIAPERKVLLQNSLVKQFPNISLIDVFRLIYRILELGDQVNWVIKYMAYLSIFTGLVVVFSIARQEAQTRTKEINLLKVLGANFWDIRTVIGAEFAIMGFSAALSGILFSLAISYTISLLFFENIWKLSLPILLINIALVTILTVLTALAATQKVLRQKPLEILQSG